MWWWKKKLIHETLSKKVLEALNSKGLKLTNEEIDLIIQKEELLELIAWSVHTSIFTAINGWRECQPKKRPR
ncbi:MAG: hypothetical protein A3A89_04420 [Candidatus Magasanikbacteria bacterium RIFCSPLOWO2_01_FULL_33_34]|nr:MAG: hypothetical protein A3A89_04420 [Candidatus Magasanikbacteria bacterium RIFCSPLOWO2_01_FULL_33_34]